MMGPLQYSHLGEKKTQAWIGTQHRYFPTCLKQTECMKNRGSQLPQETERAGRCIQHSTSPGLPKELAADLTV